MAIIFSENFAWCSASTIQDRADEVVGSDLDVQVMDGITGFYGKCLRFSGAYYLYPHNAVGYALPERLTEGLLSFALVFDSNYAITRDTLFVNTAVGRVLMMRLGVTTEKRFIVFNESTQLAISDPIDFEPWERLRIEFGFVLHPTEGSFELRLGKNLETPETILSGTGLNTSNAYGGIDRFVLASLQQPGTGAAWIYYGDVIFDTDPTAFRKDFTIDSLMLNGDVTVSGAPSTGEVNYSCLNSLPFSSGESVHFTGESTDRYALEDLVQEPAEIYGVNILYRVSKTHVGQSQTTASLHVGSHSLTTDVQQTNSVPRVHSQVFTQPPSGAERWETDDIANLNVAIEVS